MNEANRNKLKRAPTSVFLCTDEKLYKECRRYKQMALVHPLTPTQQAELDKRDLKLFAKTVDRLYQCILQKDAEQAAYKQKVKAFAEKALAQRDEDAKALVQRDEQHAKTLAQRDEEAQASYNQALLGYREKIQDLEHEKQTLRAELQEVNKAHTKELQQLRTIMEFQQSQLDTLQKAQSHLSPFVQMMQTMAVAMGPMMADMGVAKAVPPLATAPTMPPVSPVVPVASPQQHTAPAMPATPAMPTIPPVAVASAPPAAPKAPPPMPPSAPAAPPPSCASSTTSSTTRERDPACDEPPTKKRRRRRFEWVDLVAEMLFPADTVQQQQLASQMRLLVCTVPDGTKVTAEAQATAFATLVCGGPARPQYDAMVHTWRTLLTSTEAPKAQAVSFAQRVYHVCDDEGVGQGVTKGTKQARSRIQGWLMSTSHDTAFVRAMMCLMQC